MPSSRSGRSRSSRPVETTMTRRAPRRLDLLLEVLRREPAPEPDALRQRHVREPGGHRAPAVVGRPVAGPGDGPSVADRRAAGEDRERPRAPASSRRARLSETVARDPRRPRHSMVVGPRRRSRRAHRGGVEVRARRSTTTALAAAVLALGGTVPGARRPRRTSGPSATVAPAATVASPAVGRVAGADRYATSVAASRAAFPTGTHPVGGLPRLGHLPVGVAERDARRRPPGRRGPAHAGGRHPLGRRRRAGPARPGGDRRRRLDGGALGHGAGPGTRPRAGRAPRRRRVPLPDRPGPRAARLPGGERDDGVDRDRTCLDRRARRGCRGRGAPGAPPDRRRHGDLAPGRDRLPHPRPRPDVGDDRREAPGRSPGASRRSSTGSSAPRRSPGRAGATGTPSRPRSTGSPSPPWRRGPPTSRTGGTSSTGWPGPSSRAGRQRPLHLTVPFCVPAAVRPSLAAASVTRVTLLGGEGSVRGLVGHPRGLPEHHVRVERVGARQQAPTRCARRPTSPPR